MLPFPASCITLAGLIGRTCSRLEWRRIYTNTTIGVSAISDGEFSEVFLIESCDVTNSSVEATQELDQIQEHVNTPLASLVFSSFHWCLGTKEPIPNRDINYTIT